MACFRTSDFRLRLVAGIFLAIFAVQSAQASLFCELALETTGEMTASESMPCHDDGKSDQGGVCCLTCIAMADVGQLLTTPPVVQHSVVSSPAHFDLLARPDPPFRPPTHHLS